MTKRIIIAGSRNFNNYSLLTSAMYNLLVNEMISGVEVEIVSGTAKGADQLGERFAKDHNYPIKKFPADWNTHGKKAGYLRNKQMAEYADMLVAFWDGESKGTKNMIDLAEKNGLIVEVVRF